MGERMSRLCILFVCACVCVCVRACVCLLCSAAGGSNKVSDEVYMEVVVGGEEPVSHERCSYDSLSLSKDFMPVAWAAAYGQ